jgi:hypothetical protein
MWAFMEKIREKVVLKKGECEVGGLSKIREGERERIKGKQLII